MAVPYNDQMKKKDKLAVNGYVREIEDKSFKNHSFYRNIPMIINYLCMKFYHESKDRFDPKLHSSFVSIMNKSCELNRLDNYHFESAFLSNIVSKGVHQWRFKFASTLKERRCYGSMYIGIINNQVDATKYLNTQCYPVGMNRSELRRKAYGVNFAMGEFRGDYTGDNEKVCERCKDGNIIDMFLDFKNMELRYCVNDKDYGKPCNISKGSYRACVTLYFETDKLTLLHYKIK